MSVELKNNIPELRFSEFEGNTTDSYAKTFFKDIFLFSTGKNIKQKEASPEFEIPCVRYGELYHMYNEVINEIINRTNLDKSELLFSKGDEILLPSAGEDPLDIGSASALTIPNVAIGRTINILRPIKNNIYSQKYVSYYINQKLRKKISTLAKGVSISNVYNSDLKKLVIILPTSLPEQTKIATFLTAVDKRINLLQKKKAELEDYKKGSMQKLFSQTVRFKPALSGVEGNDDGSSFPDWEEKKLGEVCEINPNTGRLPNTFIYVDLESVNKGNLVKKNKISKEDAPSRAQRVLQRGDIIYQTVRPYQKNNYFFDNNGDYVASTGYAQIRANQDKRFLFQYIHSEKFVNNVLKRCTGTSYPAIGSSDLKTISVSVPSLEEQQKIADFLSSIDTSIENITNQIDDSVVFKKGLLQKMFV